jgi:putative salt-induced outer membrane protein YdiY
MIVVISLYSISFADEVIFKNGERLIGEFERLEEGKLIFKSQIAGEITVGIDKVEDIYSVKALEIHLKDGKILKSKTFKSEADHFTVEGTEERKEQTFAMSDLSAINPPVIPKVRWSGSISAGFTSSHGSSFSENASVNGDLVMRTEKHRITIDGRYVVERDENDNGDKKTTTENFTIQGKYDYFFTKKFFGYLSERFKKDHIDDLDYRYTSVIGAGYQWSETDMLTFSTYGGPGLLQEKYTSRIPDPTGEKKWAKVVERKDDFILQTGYNLVWEPHDKVNFRSSLTYNPSIDDFSNYNLTYDAEVRAFITKSLYSSFKFILDYDSTPGEDSASTDTDYILGFGWQF